MKYSEKLKDPRWQRKRLEIFERDGWTCRGCYDEKNTLAVHHLKYLPGKDPWDYPDELLLTLCKDCHEAEREHRPIVEQALLGFLQEKGFLCGDIGTINHGFSGIKMVHTPEVMATAIAWAFRDAVVMRRIVDEYLENLTPKNKPENKVAP